MEDGPAGDDAHLVVRLDDRLVGAEAARERPALRHLDGDVAEGQHEHDDERGEVAAEAVEHGSAPDPAARAKLEEQMEQIAVGTIAKSTRPWSRTAQATATAARARSWRRSVGRSSARATANAAVRNAGRKAFSVMSIPV